MRRQSARSSRRDRSSEPWLRQSSNRLRPAIRRGPHRHHLLLQWLARSARRRAKEIVQNAGANSEERFNHVVLGDVTFREHAKIYLQMAVSRKRNPLRDTVSVEGAM